MRAVEDLANPVCPFCGSREGILSGTRFASLLVCDDCGGLAALQILRPVPELKKLDADLRSQIFARSRMARIGRRWTRHCAGRLDACVRCACTQERACPGGCFWIDDGLCARCGTCKELLDAGVIRSNFGLPFSGEPMICLACGTGELSRPKIRSDWRVIATGDLRFYFCPQEFPPDRSSATKFEAAYSRLLGLIQSVPDLPRPLPV